MDNKSSSEIMIQTSHGYHKYYISFDNSLIFGNISFVSVSQYMYIITIYPQEYIK